MKKIHHLASLATAAVAFCAALTACGEEAPALTSPCAVVVDGSGSGTRLDAARLLREHLADFLYAKGCATLAFSPITGASESTKCNYPNVDLDPAAVPGADVTALRRRAYKQAEKTAADVLDCAKKEGATEAPGSDVLGGISKAVGTRPEGTGAYHILVISDFAQSDSTVDLYHDSLAPADREMIIARLNAKARIPDLSGTTITYYGFGAGYAPSQAGRVALLRAFWAELVTGPGHGTAPVQGN